MPSRLWARLARLEARRPPVVIDSTSLALSEAFVAEVWRLLWTYGQFPSVAAMLAQCAGLTDEASRAAVSQMLQETPLDAL